MEAAITNELALRYLLELSTDIRLALLMGQRGDLIAAADDRPSERVLRLSVELAQVAESLGGNGAESIELDVTVDDGAVFLVREKGPALICVTGRFALPGLILHDMRAVLNDLGQGGSDKISQTPGEAGR
jgi:hypothetical protein